MGIPAMSPPTGTDTRGGGIRRWLHRVRVAVGLAATPAPAIGPAPADRGTELAEQRTRLAIKRSFLAAERTLMAWMRTSLSMISFGFTMAKVFETLETQRQLTVGWLGHSWAPATLGLTLITIGTGALVVAVVQHWHTLKELRKEGLEPKWSLTLNVAALVAVLGVFAFGSLILHY
jgi:putative membrane protein